MAVGDGVPEGESEKAGGREWTGLADLLGAHHGRLRWTGGELGSETARI